MDRVWDYVMDISGTLLKTMPDQCSPQVQAKLLPIYMKRLIDLNSRARDLAPMLDALCLLCDCIEFGNDALFNAISGQAAPKLIQVIEELG